LLRRGVRLFEYPHTLLHQKVMTVDGVWCAVGSSNFDDRSFETNDELTLGIADAETAKHRLIDNMYYLINEVL
jgi:cardiolipin synthase